MIPDKLSRLRQIINGPAACLSTTALNQSRTLIFITQTPDTITDIAVITPLHPLCRLVQIDISIPLASDSPNSDTNTGSPLSIAVPIFAVSH